MMDYMHRVVNYVNVNVFKKPVEKAQVEEEPMSKWDGYLNFVCKIVSWEDPTLTWISFIVINLIYSFIIYYDTRFYCVLFTSAAVLVALDYYDEAIKFGNLKRYVYFNDITNMCASFMYNMHVWKRDNPSLFCGVVTTFFLILSVIGRTISGRVLSYFLFLGVYFGPTLIKLAPIEVQNTFMQFINTLRTNDIVSENELMPLITENFDNDDEKTQDSFTSSLISGMTSMPSHLDAVDTGFKSLEEDDLLPRRVVDSSDSDSDLPDGMHFKTQHFIKDSSSSDEERFTKGMNFAELADASPFLGSLAAVGSNLLSNLQSNFASQTQPKDKDRTNVNIDKKKRRDSSDNSDFEIINTDDAIDT